MVIESHRLLLIPLSARQMGLWIKDIKGLERELSCVYDGDDVSGPFGDVVTGQIPAVRAAGENYPLSTFWLLLRKEDRVVVGSACFKGVDDNGEVEIGYGVAEPHRKNGYATEAVAAMCRWALDRPGVTGIFAETGRENTASQRVLEKCGMYRTGVSEEGYLWRQSPPKE